MIYFMAKEGTDEVKIGWSISVDQRRKQLIVDHKCKLNVIRNIDGDPWVEQWFHWRFASLWLHHEWFTFHPEMMTIDPPDEKPEPFPKNRSRYDYDPSKPRQKAPKTYVLLARMEDELKDAIEHAAREKEWSVSHWLGSAAKAMLGRK